MLWKGRRSQTSPLFSAVCTKVSGNRTGVKACSEQARLSIEPNVGFISDHRDPRV